MRTERNPSQPSVLPIWICGVFGWFPGMIATMVQWSRARRGHQPEGRIWLHFSLMTVVVFGVSLLITHGTVFSDNPNDSVGTIPQNQNSPTPDATGTPAPTNYSTPTPVGTLSPASAEADQQLCLSYGGLWSPVPGGEGSSATCRLPLPPYVGTAPGTDAYSTTVLFSPTGVTPNPCADYTWTTTHNDTWTWELQSSCNAPPETVAKAQTNCASQNYYPTNAQSSENGWPYFEGQPTWNSTFDVCVPQTIE
jgi:hypothetical protein